MYKAVFNDNYLCHYNKNHSKTNGQFTSGDGDGDGISNDHAHRIEKDGKKSGKQKLTKKQIALGITGLAIGTAGLAMGIAGLAQTIHDTNQLKKFNEATLKGFQSAGKNFSTSMSKNDYKTVLRDEKWEETRRKLEEVFERQRTIAKADKYFNPHPHAD